MNEATFTGTLVQIGEPQEISATFSKREIRLRVVNEYDGKQTEKFLVLECNNKYMDIVSPQMLNQEVRVSYRAESRMWTKPDGTEMWFTSAKAYKAELVNHPAMSQVNNFGGGQQPQQSFQPQTYPNQGGQENFQPPQGNQQGFQGQSVPLDQREAPLEDGIPF